MKSNKKELVEKLTEEGAKAAHITPYQSLRRSVLSTLLFEDNFYEDGISVSERIKELIKAVSPEKVADLAIEARTKFKLRHIPLFLVRELARYEKSRYLVAETLSAVIQRPDELGEFLSLYNKDGKQPLAASVKKGLSRAFQKFDEYSLQKYNGGTPEYKLRDVLFLCHAKPKNEEQENLWKKLINNQLETPETWETKIGKDGKKEAWESLLHERKLGSLALLRNLRNFKVNGVSEKLIKSAISEMKTDRVLPFRFITAAKYYPSLESELEGAMFKCSKNIDKVSGKTLLLIDVSGSMDKPLSSNSEMTRLEAANSLAILAREICEEVKVFTFSKQIIEIPARRGFSLRDAINSSQPHKDTYLGAAIKYLNENESFERLIVISDEQSDDEVQFPKCPKAYMINVANNKNGVGYNKNWINISGMSESVFDYIQNIEE